MSFTAITAFVLLEIAVATFVTAAFKPKTEVIVAHLATAGIVTILVMLAIHFTSTTGAVSGENVMLLFIGLGNLVTSGLIAYFHAGRHANNVSRARTRAQGANQAPHIEYRTPVRQRF